MPYHSTCSCCVLRTWTIRVQFWTNQYRGVCIELVPVVPVWLSRSKPKHFCHMIITFPMLRSPNTYSMNMYKLYHDIFNYPETWECIAPVLRNIAFNLQIPQFDQQKPNSHMLTQVGKWRREFPVFKVARHHATCRYHNLKHISKVVLCLLYFWTIDEDVGHSFLLAATLTLRR